jgi:hypothetical protein
LSAIRSPAVHVLPVRLSTSSAAFIAADSTTPATAGDDAGDRRTASATSS